MDIAKVANSPPTLIGRSSSHFTRVTRIFAAELEVEVAFRVVSDLTTLDVAAYSGNPTLRVPILRTENADWFGTQSICRQLWRLSQRRAKVIWPEHIEQALLCNAQELTLQAMASEVSLIMSKLSGVAADAPYSLKLETALTNSLAWLEAHVDNILSGLPAERDLSFLEVTLYCLLRHLQFRQLLARAPIPRLLGFCEEFEARPSAKLTPYHFDA